MDDFYVYSYWLPEGTPGACDPLYIGKGQGNRAYGHLWIAKSKEQKTIWHKKLRQLLDDGIKPEVDFLGTGLSENDAFLLEAEMIQKFRRLDLGTGCLYNCSDGGEGNAGPSQETREKMSRARRARPPQSLETKRLIRSSVLAYWTPERRKERSEDPRWRRPMVTARPISGIRWDGTVLYFRTALEAEAAGYYSLPAKIQMNIVYKGAKWGYV